MKHKKLLIALGIVVVVLLLLAVVLPALIDVNRYKPDLESALANSLGRKVQIGDIKLSILSGSVTVADVSVADDPSFSRSPFLKAKDLSAGVELIPLIFSKQLNVSSITVDEPEIQLLRSPSGTWNFSSLGAGASSAPAKSSRASDPPAVSVAKLKISDGKVIVGSTGARGKPRTYDAVNLTASDLSYTSQFPFELTAKAPGGGTLKLDGKAGPVDAKDASLTPLNAKIEVSHLDLASTGFVDPSSGLAGVLDFTGDLTSDGRQMTSKGSAKADKVKLVAAGSPSRVPLKLDYATAYDLQSNKGRLSQGDVRIGKALARLTGTYDASGASTTVQMKLSGQSMPVTDLEGALPAVGVTLPSGASLASGTANVDLALSGPLDKLVITGPVNLSNAKLAGFSLMSKLGALSSFTGLGGGGGSDTVIQTLSANLRLDPAGTRADNLNLVIPSLGTVTGNGLISANGQLNCKMLATLTSSAGGAAGALNSELSSLMGGGKSSKGTGIPFTITGTTSDPKFAPDVTGMVGSAIQNRAAGATGSGTSPVDQASGILGGLLGKKKSQ